MKWSEQGYLSVSFKKLKVTANTVVLEVVSEKNRGPIQKDRTS